MKIDKKIIEMLGIQSNIDEVKIFKDNLIKHIKKRKHDNVLPYLDVIEDIISNPDFVGVSPKEPNTSMELIKVYDDNVLVAIKIHQSEQYFYVPTMYTITDYKLNSRLHGGRLKRFDKKKK